MFYLEINEQDTKRIGIKKYQQEFFYYNAGEIFEPEININTIYKKIQCEAIENFLGEYNYLFENEEYIYIFSDELGSIKWFYYYQNNEFIISNDLWKIAKEKSLGIENINKQSFYESVLFYFPLKNKTYFQDIFVIPPGSLLIFSKKSKKLEIKKIKKIKYTPKKLKKEECFKQIDNAFKKMILKIERNNKNLYLGITISGGLDSRFPLFYTKHIEQKFAYLIGIKKYFYDPLDLISSKKLAKIFKIRLKLINPFSKIDLKTKLYIDIARNPIGPSNFLKAINKQKSFSQEEQFNVLLTGAYGGLIGGRILNDSLLKASKTELADRMFYYYSSFHQLNLIEKGSANKEFVKKSMIKLLIHLGIKNQKQIDFNREITSFLQNNFLIPKITKKTLFKNFGVSFKESKEQNISDIMTFHLYRHSIRGAFESLHGQVKSYSIYYPYIYELSKKWDESFLKNRSLMEDFIIWKSPETAHIPLQNFSLPLHLRNTRINAIKKIWYKISSFGNFAFRGLVINYNKWWHRKDIQKLVHNILYEDVKTFYEIFPQNDIQKIYKYKRYDLILEQLLKLKVILRIIEQKQYDFLIDLKIDESSKY